MSETKRYAIEDRSGNELNAEQQGNDLAITVEQDGFVETEIATIRLTKSKAMSLGWWLLTTAAEMGDD